MSKIEEFKSLKQELESLKAITAIDIFQIDHGNMGGPDAQFIVHGLKAGDVAVLVKYIKDKWLTDILPSIKKEKKIVLEAARIAANAEATQFTTENSTTIV